MGVLDPVVFLHPAWSMNLVQIQHPGCCSIGGQLVRDDGLGVDAHVAKQTTQQLQGGILVATLLDQDIKNFTFIIHGPPQPHASSIDPDHHLIQVPAGRGARTGLAQIRCNHWPELVDPAPDRLPAGLNSSFRQQFLHIPDAERVSKIPADGCGTNC